MSKGKEWIAGIDILKIISMLMIITYPWAWRCS